MQIAPPVVEPSTRSVQRDRARIRYAVIGASALLAGIWLCWLAAWAMGWDMLDLGVRPRDPNGLVGILSAPFVHASLSH